MHRLVLTATLALASLATAATAQQQTTPEQSPNPGMRHLHRQRDPHKQAVMLSHRLNLSQDQTARLEPILAARQQKVQALMADTSLTPDARRAQFKAIHQETRQQLAGVLTPDQLEQMKAMRHHRGGPQGQASAEAPPAA